MSSLGRSCALLGLFTTFAVACGDSEPSKTPNNVKPAGTGGSGAMAGAAGQAAILNPCGEVDPSLKDKDASELFGFAKIPTFDMVLPADAWAELKTHARDEKYVEAQACFEGKAIGPVGLRFKGSYGSLYNCFDSSGINTCRKLGMKLKFDKYDPDARFYGLKRLNLHGYHYDDSYLKERLSYDLYAAMDIVTPRAAWALLRVNGEPQGLFGMVEDVDGRFTASRWPDNGDANLYKELWPGQTDEAEIASRLETNEELGQTGNFQAFSQAIKTATSEQLRETVGRFVDLEYWARYMAVDDAIANFDGITTYYTSGAADESGNHNFYLYEEAANRFTLIPWDLESTLSTVSGFGYVPPWQTTPTDCSVTYRAWGDSTLRVVAPGCDPVFRALNADLSEYHAAARRLLDGPFVEATMLANIDRLASFIRAEASADPHGPGAAKFESAVGFMRQDIAKLRARLEYIQTGKSTVPCVLPLGETMGFETNDDYGLTVGTLLMCNTNSTTSVTLNKTAPITGSQSLRMLFNFGNEAEAWQQWSIYHIPIADGPKDLNGFSGIRFKARSNAARTLRFDLISPNDSLNNDGIHFGWDISLKTEVATFEVRFADAKVPDWAKDPGDQFTDILATTASIGFQPICNDRGATGQLAEGTPDNGWIEVDDIEIF
ncbi:MAG TPA: CotH kinase family protein [Polyangiaceae bacterium]|nr:CotH kinase family protein [Polyangiaceae bacterium]